MSGCPDCKRKDNVLKRLGGYLQSIIGGHQKFHKGDVDFAIKDVLFGLNGGPKPPPVYALKTLENLGDKK